jgi:uncharacterized membrane protein YbhN (UPF0104 family)
MNGPVKTIAQLFILVAVLVGLFFSAIKASDQWKEQTQQINASISELEQLLETEANAETRSIISKQRDQLKASLPTLGNLNFNYLLMSLFFYTAGLTPSGLLLHRAVQAFGYRPRVSTTLAAHMLGHVGKYVPGKALVVILRATVLGREGVSIKAATISVFVETFLMMAVGGSIASAVLIWLPLPQWVVWLSIASAVVASIPTLPPVLSKILVKLGGRTGRLSDSGTANEQSFDNHSVKTNAVEIASRDLWNVFFAGWFLSILTWLLFGLSFTCVIQAIPSPENIPNQLQLFFISTAAISLAVVVGFASLLPGGAGVRELVLAAILGIILSPSHGLLAAILARMVHMTSEAIMASLAWIWLRLSSSKIFLKHA